jgi:hypothetical protein
VAQDVRRRVRAIIMTLLTELEIIGGVESRFVIGG